MPYKDPEAQRAAKREWARRARVATSGTPRGTGGPSGLLLPEALRIHKAEDVLALLQEQVNAVRADSEAGTLAKARTIGFLASVMLRAVEARDLDARVGALEAVLRARQAP